MPEVMAALVLIEKAVKLIKAIHAAGADPAAELARQTEVWKLKRGAKARARARRRG